MNCKCGNLAFFYETIKPDNIKYNIYKCGTLLSEKKEKCNFKLEHVVKKVENLNPIAISQIDTIETYEEDPKIVAVKNLEQYIYLFEISTNNYGMCRDNYVSNINFNLRKLFFPLFFPKNESISSLKLRIYNVSIVKKSKIYNYPEILIEIPDNLRTVNKKFRVKNSCIKTKSIKTTAIKKSTLNIKDYIKIDEELLDKIKKMEIVSDNSDTESKIDEDNSFDIDSYDSELDASPFDDGGGLSD
jgi:hypothetical protein